MKPLVTTDAILEYLRKKVETKDVIAPSIWMDACVKLIVLVPQEQDKLFDLQKQVSVIKMNCMAEGSTAASAKVTAEASDVYWTMKKQEATVENIYELIRISKLQSKIRAAELGVQ